MRLTLSCRRLLSLALATLAASQQVVPELSFGYSDASISPDGVHIPGWTIQDDGQYKMQILSDRILVTPPVPGNVRGGIFTDRSAESETWSIVVDFRVAGPEGGSGNLQIWYAKDKNAIGIDSVYNVREFDGLAVVIDQYGGRGGSARGFLNDASVNHQREHGQGTLDSRAFGHCDFAYRNLGRTARLRITSHQGLRVSIDDQTCFATDQISLPSGYFFGLTAHTGEPGDSLEIHRFAIEAGIPHEHAHVVKGGSPPQGQRVEQRDTSLFPGAPEAVADQAADQIRNADAQFADLHNRLQALAHQLANVFGEINTLNSRLEERHGQLLAGLPTVPHDKIDSLGRRVENMEQTVNQIRVAVEGRDYKEHLDRLNSAIEGVRGGLTENLPDTIGKLIQTSAPRMGMFVFIILAVQIMMAGAYIVYKRRRASMPKKYL